MDPLPWDRSYSSWHVHHHNCTTVIGPVYHQHEVQLNQTPWWHISEYPVQVYMFEWVCFDGEWRGLNPGGSGSTNWVFLIRETECALAASTSSMVIACIGFLFATQGFLFIKLARWVVSTGAGCSNMSARVWMSSAARDPSRNLLLCALGCAGSVWAGNLVCAKTKAGAFFVWWNTSAGVWTSSAVWDPSETLFLCALGYAGSVRAGNFVCAQTRPEPFLFGGAVCLKLAIWKCT